MNHRVSYALVSSGIDRAVLAIQRDPMGGYVSSFESEGTHRIRILFLGPAQSAQANTQDSLSAWLRLLSKAIQCIAGVYFLLIAQQGSVNAVIG